MGSPTTLYRIIDLTAFSGRPAGTELAEISTAGSGSFQMSLAVLAASRTAINVTSASRSVAATDYGDVLVNFGGAVTIQLPTANSRVGVPVSVVDISGAAASNNITILPNGAETIMGQSSLVISGNYGSFNLWPISTGNWYTK